MTLPLTRSYAGARLELRGRPFAWGTRTFVMGIVNATPDSFSGDGVQDPSAAAALAAQFEADGADMIDIGAESSRPGAQPLGPAVEAARLLPVLAAVRAATSLPVSVDTYHAQVAAAALDAGADAVNDISGLRADAAMATVVASHGAALVAMHNQRGRTHSDPIADIRAGFEATLAIAGGAGIDRARIVLDPGFGFGWRPEQNLEVVRRLPELWDFALPLLLGPSRKSTIGLILDAPAGDRVEGTAALVALGIVGGADIVRVHDVRAMARVAKVADATVRGRWRPDTARPMTEVVLALGANLGDRAANLRAALKLLAERGVRVTRTSGVWETPPFPPGQPRFLNAVAVGETSLGARALLAAAKEVEELLGRVPGPRWGPRPADVDILFYGQEQVREPDLVIPHERIVERAFVLVPLRDVYPGSLPVLGKTAAELLSGLDQAGITRTGETL